MEVEFLSQMRYNLFVSPQQWDDWKTTISRMYSYHRECLRQRMVPKKVFYTNIPPSPPVTTIPTSPSFNEQPPYMPMPSSPFRMHYAPFSERMSSPHRVLPPMDDSPGSASAAVHARITSRKRSREENPGLLPPTKRYQAQYNPGPLGIQMSQQSQRLHYPTDTIQHSLQPQYSEKPQPRVSLSLTLPEQMHSPSYRQQHQPLYPLQPISPSYPTSPYAASPLSPFSTASNYNSLSPYAVPSHRQSQQTPQPALLESQVPAGYSSGYSSPYKYLQNRFSPYAPVRPVRTLPSQFIPPRMQWSLIPPNASEELWYQPLGLHGHSGLRKGIPTYPNYNPEYQQQYHRQQQSHQNHR
jgi:hypothetical protein